MNTKTAALNQPDTDDTFRYEWGLWVYRIMLGMGTSLILAGIIFFFAYNWNAIHHFAKFGIVEGAMVLCLAGAAVRKLDSLPGKLLLLSASVLVGVFMAVFGQVYQTGADAYQLFMMWSILTFGWVLISRFPTHWVFWLLITNVFIITYWQQEVGSNFGQRPLLYIILIALNGVALILREMFLKLGFLWLNERWTRILGVIVILGMSLVPLIWFIFSIGDTSHYHKTPPLLAPAALVGAIVLGICLYIYRFQIADIWAHALSVIALWFVVEAAGERILYLNIASGRIEAVGFLFFSALMTIGLISVFGHYLRSLGSKMSKEEQS